MAVIKGVTAAREVQKRLLEPPPQVKGVDLAVSWAPYGEVGGDFYDFILLEEESFGLVLGDVSGKGYDAALLMVFALAELRAGLRNHLRLPYIMAQLDESLRNYSTANRFAEVLIGIYAPFSRRFVFVQGGGIVPVVFHQSTEKLFLKRSATYRVPGIPIVHDSRRRYVEELVELEEGDVMLLMTDGISEREDAMGRKIIGKDDFGAWVSPILKDICLEQRDSTAQELLASMQGVLDGLDSARLDDETVIVLKAC